MSREGFRPVHGVAAEVSECPEEVQEKLRGQLQGLGLSGEGDPCFWNGMGCLHCKVLRIWSKEASGDLSSIKEMTKLRDLRLAGSRITGNVSELSKLKDLVRLHLSQTEVMGDLAELSKLTALEDLRLPHTQVSGNVAKLSKLKELWHLDLAQTEVMGDLAELSKLTALKYLHLPHTQVVGDVSMLSNMTGLRDLSLAQSRVHGNFGVISSMPNLVKADLSSTAVSGNLGDLESDCCKKLRELHLGVPASELQQCFFYVFVEKCGCTVWNLSFLLVRIHKFEFLVVI